MNFMNVHIQAGGSDCGLFAIANAVALLLASPLECSSMINNECGITCGSVSRTERLLHFQ